MDSNGRIKLCDFGISGRLVDSQARTRGAGCAAYLSPERIDPERGTYDVRADIWSLATAEIYSQGLQISPETWLPIRSLPLNLAAPITERGLIHAEFYPSKIQFAGNPHEFYPRNTNSRGILPREFYSLKV